ncbi:unnamed protein product [Trifolium pratense]|uniref:Uncharacterized protein n=1 Tax=Trifolium pratense TaxID=57577 RepID=A0ACB0L3I5_TRIPR|nr:unnamed protein product [Trifolium pratense]
MEDSDFLILRSPFVLLLCAFRVFKGLFSAAVVIFAFSRCSRHMDDPSAPSLSENDIQPTKKRCRCGTRMKQMSLRYNGVKTPVDFDQSNIVPNNFRIWKKKNEADSCDRVP